MSVKIKIKGNKETNEFKDAIALKEIFESEFRDGQVNGEILIICNATLFGQETKDIDLIAIGKFERFSKRLKAKHKTSEGIADQEIRTVFINDFCFVFETKRHRATDIRLDGLTLSVKYNDKRSDVTTQSENQKYSLTNFFKDRINFSPYVCNFIWLRNVNWDSIKNLLGDNTNIHDKHNYLPNTFSVSFLMQLACVQSIPWTPTDKNSGKLKGYSAFNSLRRNQEFDINEVDRIFDLFKKVKDGSGELTRKKIEKITSQILNDQQYAKAIGDKLIIISGRAGTGKTIKLLSIACDLATQQGARSLILTYNHALVSDIKRTLALAEIPDGIDDYTVNITTLHKFFYEIVIGFEIGDSVQESKNNKKFIRNFIGDYKSHLETLKEYLDLNLIGEKEISELMKTRHQQVGWDYLLIDEAQDWGELEKEIIFKIFGKEKIIIADGVDQLIRSQNKCNWTRALKPNFDFKKTHEKKGLRQKVNLVNFVNKFAEKLNINWELESKQELIGGKVIISTKGYFLELHQRQFELVKINGNSAYEMMFLVPPALVERYQKMDEYNQPYEDKRFIDTDKYKERGINFWDGTSRVLRTEYVVDLNEHRLLQYESCRGLEGWTVVNLDFDKFIDYKMQTFEEEETNELALESIEEKRRRFVYLWALIPLTRAIDTLVITLSNPNGYIGKVLREVYEENPDFVEWID
ncbi:AAA family ATPase [Salinimicrobium xinjiangense]|uniref:AAA family ATPase n=1 Tax=Salinimicrobium xinjiangense TaxID=438596 RepID=UPI000415F9A1|nr:AAA family ATPase [Salinimicrobium xinjiangense]